MIEVLGVSKSYGDKPAADDLTFTVRPGVVTGFLGPNGAGKSTTMRMIVGLTRPDRGTVLVNGRPYAEHPAPLHEVGTLLDARAVHPRRSAYHHLRVLTATHGIARSRIDQVLDMVGLRDVARRRPGAFSLGMSQRLGIAAALLGDPSIVVLDEPVNGLDPDGVRWVRELLRELAAEGRTVFLSSHLMSEMELTADQLVIVGRGRLIADLATSDMTAALTPKVRVRTPQPECVLPLFPADAVDRDADPEWLTITGRTAEQIAQLAAAYRIPVYELTPVRTSLEDAYLAMTHGDVEYAASAIRDRRVAA
ncbi:MAG TPA: ABC transporter ATP-binding protein [Actinoplanes sp.]|jgi:ABC-2 type transport system ATP-binding protein